MESRIRLGLIGYGEVGKIFSAGLKAQPGVAAVGAWDLKFAAPTPARPSAPTRPRPACRRTIRPRRCARPARW